MFREKRLPIIIHGVIPAEKLYELYTQMNAVLIATACETCCMTALEAMS